ncbi:hypothetical protein ISN44_As04g002840 [Arabidopsis suecica]|uniref:Uncharacterized protein n=2 Tax=Arabidopsis TaxID=3701 RepID=F4JHJ3_ARATH|nr:uncharacterized protein AT4G02465 [Arabidopsis thaliana]AEE82176.1 hypothetical protein AT4G02465 [Arabidopsis thaliana]KAG7619379.1 hypothetical protein ISN44_As04g002840 [Arabidopsis suecica]|eukprot:NP_680562.1 hypothetical protein AT4G02465 [Arabidopsis thaliana]
MAIKWKRKAIRVVASSSGSVWIGRYLIDDDDVDEQSQEFQIQLNYQDMATEEEDKLLDALLSKDGASIAKRLSNCCFAKFGGVGIFMAEQVSSSKLFWRRDMQWRIGRLMRLPLTSLDFIRRRMLYPSFGTKHFLPLCNGK